jgi:hypothetical protein
MSPRESRDSAETVSNEPPISQLGRFQAELNERGFLRGALSVNPLLCVSCFYRCTDTAGGVRNLIIHVSGRPEIKSTIFSAERLRVRTHVRTYVVRKNFS